MIASWMLYALAISALMSVAALAAERAMSARRRPTRFVWAAALALSLAWPLGPTIRRLLPARAPVSGIGFTIVVQAPSVIAAPDAPDRAALIDRGLIVFWGCVSALLLLRIGSGVVRLQRTRSAWKRGRLDGVAVQFSDNVGPAVVGLRSMDVVLPEWIRTLDAPLRAIVLRHEEEHRTARDPYLLFGAAIAVALMPWNVALWFQARRLRLAIEMDCDARVLRVHPSPERYGMLMLTIAQRRSVSPALYAPMLTEPTTQLERRILAMRTTTRRLARVTMYGGAAVTVAVLVFASSLQSAGTTFPTSKMSEVLKLPAVISQAAGLTRPETIPVRRPTMLPGATAEQEQAIMKADEERRVVAGQMIATQQGNAAPRYPDMLRAAEVEGAVVVRYMTDARGVPDSSSIAIISSTHGLFEAAVRRVLPSWHMTPNASIQTPFIFVMNHMSAKDVASMKGSWPAGTMVITATQTVEGMAYPKSTNTVGQLVEVPVNQVTRPRLTEEPATYFEFQVEKQVSPMPGNPAARYPTELRQASISGEVLAQFVVGTDGLPDMTTFKVLKSTHDQFTDAVRTALPNMRFFPALVGGQPVKQLVQMPFNFSVTP